MSLIKNLIEQVKSKERFNYRCYMNNIYNPDLEDFFKECKENNQRVYPTWSSVKLLYSKRKNGSKGNNNSQIQSQSRQRTPIVIIDDDSSISSRTRSRVNSARNNMTDNNPSHSQVTIEDFFFPRSMNNLNNNVNVININDTANASNYDNIFNFGDDSVFVNNTNNVSRSRSSARSNRGTRATRGRGNSRFHRVRKRGRRTNK